MMTMMTMMIMKTKMMVKKMIKKWIQRNDKEESTMYKDLGFYNFNINYLYFNLKTIQ